MWLGSQIAELGEIQSNCTELAQKLLLRTALTRMPIVAVVWGTLQRQVHVGTYEVLMSQRLHLQVQGRTRT